MERDITTITNEIWRIIKEYDFLSRTQKAQNLRERMSKWDCIKLKSTANGTVSRLKRLPTKWDKIFASYLYIRH
jgi:hypothetical protein